jgi:uncharacterized protein with FMN-binding domain
VRRIATWFLSTVTVVVLMFGYHTSTSGVPGATSQPAITSGDVAGAGSPSTGAATATAGATTATGSVAQTQWGPVQVQLTVNGGDIADIQVLQYPSGNPRDSEINSLALPVLIQETLDAQSADIDMVSGATVTSVGYTESLQSALDQAGL